jgi:hypothetical protein
MPDCNNTSLPPFFRPVVFWFLTLDTPNQGAATFCAPTISLLDVSVNVDINNGSLTSVEDIQPLNSSTSPLASISQNVTGAPLNGQAFNGIQFNLTSPDEFVQGRLNATTLQLPASIFQAVSKGPGGVTGAFQTNSFTPMASKVYVSL